MQSRFTKSAQKALDCAERTAKSLGHNYVGTEHILLGLLKSKGVASEVLQENGVETEKIQQLIEELLSVGNVATVIGQAEFTPRAQSVIEKSVAEAERLGAAVAGTEHILIALLKENDCVAVRVLNTKGINVQKLYIDVLTATGQDVTSAKNEYMMQRGKRGKSATPMLDQFSRDLTE